MQNFVFQCATKIIFGRNTENQIGNEVKNYSRKVLLHYGAGSIKRSGLYDKVIKSLQEADIEIFELGGVLANPRLSMVREGISQCHENGIDFILAVGGGSVIDSAKAIAVGVPYDGDVWDFFIRKSTPVRALPLGVILTIPATGSEASKSAVITNEDGWYKRSIGYDLLRPAFAIMNPEFSVTLPPYQTAVGAVDIMSHVMERYFTNVTNVELTDRLCEATLKTVLRNTPLVMQDPEDYNARAEIMWAGTIAHNDLLSTGRIGDFGSHKIEHELSGIYDVAHGVGLAVIFPAWMKYIYKNNVDRFVQFAVRVFDLEIDFEASENTALEGINKLEEFFKSLDLPTHLSELHITDERFEEMASKCTEKGPVGFFTKLYKEDVLNILELAR
ncbi:iron-containing alcohol dehydrogenase [Desulfosporosinus fructosivorans]|uniref:Iron-containing alcohol dehydrogenase n=1 Tax=Desulfosporosinus fructosivorans TaxID=2018669 RepID=A0A4Z0QYX1_9FIRM|nr:iron-containing alcohol dehydrogenase [Desulfosporosinus fructosivorans]TGE35630.1 iron-containing alcohol dehydrogenase [Desulfosporosinus fructosivorans]